MHTYISFALAFCGGFLVCAAAFWFYFKNKADIASATRYNIMYNDQMQHLIDRYNEERVALGSEYAKRYNAERDVLIRATQAAVREAEREVNAVIATIQKERAMRNRRHDDAKEFTA